MQGTNLRQKEGEGNIFPQVFAVLGDSPIYLDILGSTKMVLSPFQTLEMKVSEWCYTRAFAVSKTMCTFAIYWIIAAVTSAVKVKKKIVIDSLSFCRFLAKATFAHTSTHTPKHLNFFLKNGQLLHCIFVYTYVYIYIYVYTYVYICIYIKRHESYI